MLSSLIASFKAVTLPAPKELASKARVSKLLIHPVKSCGGISADEAEITQNGFRYDRQWLIVDFRFCTARELPNLVLIRTKIEPPLLTLTIPTSPSPSIVTVALDPSDSELASLELLHDVRIWDKNVDAHAISAEADAALSAYLGKPVRLVGLASEEEGGRMRIGTDELVGEERDEVTAAFHDQYPYTIATSPSLEAIKEALHKSSSPKLDPSVWPSKRIDAFAVERFRPNIFLESVPESQLSAWEEDSWTKISVGSATRAEGEGETFHVPGRLPRCLLTGVDPETGEPDKNAPYGVISQFRIIDPGHRIKPCFAISAVSARPGNFVWVCDELRVLGRNDPAERVYMGIGSTA